MHAVCGRSQQSAHSLLMKFDEGDARWARDPSSQALGWFATVRALH